MKNTKASRRNFLIKAGLGTAGMALASTLSNATASNNVPSEGIASKLLPPRLKPGQTIAMIAPAGAIFSSRHIAKFRGILQGMGFKVHEGASLREKHGYLAGTDDFRAKEFNDLIANPDIHGIIAMRGGWGCARILDKIDYSKIQENPKVIMGFSDLTSLLIAITAKTGLMTYHGPVGYSSWGDYSKRYVERLLIDAEANVILENPAEKVPETLFGGKATGELVGGNLTVLAGIIGSQYLPNWTGKILFLEETREEVYRIDRMITQLKLAGVLDQINGIVFGVCNHCDPENEAESLTMKQMLTEHLQPLGIPVLTNAAFGHVNLKYTLPIGAAATLDADAGTITMNAAVVR